jgi:multidrug efflux pump
MFAFPPLIDVKVDQPESEIEIDRDKVAELGLNLETVAQDLAAALGGNFVNRFSVAGRSYKVIPQLLRAERLNPSQLSDIYITGPNGQLIALDAIAKIHNAVVPRSLNRFQQLNAVKISGVAIRPLDDALAYLESEAAKIVPKATPSTTPASRASCAPRATSSFPPSFLPWSSSFWCSRRSSTASAIRFVILAGSVPLGMFGALALAFLKMPNPNMPYWTDGWTTTLNVYSQIGLVTLVGLVSKNGILIVQFANKLQEQGYAKIDAVKEAAVTRLRPILMTSVATICGHFPSPS